MQILEEKSGQLRQAQPGLYGQEDQRVIATAGPRALIRRSQQSVNFLSIQERHQSASKPLGRNSEHALDLRGTRWLLECDVTEEGMDGSQSQVARSGRHCTGRFQVLSLIHI